MYKTIRPYIGYMLAVYCLFAAQLYAQTPLGTATVYNTNSGLPQSSIYGMLQTRNGFMWFATGDGLARFDGREWSVYRTNFTYKDKPASNLLNTNLYEDSEGTVWCTNASGIFYKKQGDKKLQFFCPNNDTAHFFNVNCRIAGVVDNSIWMASGYGYLANYNCKTKETKIYNFSQLLLHNNMSITAAHYYQGCVYIATYNKIIVFNSSNNLFSQIVFSNKGFALAYDITDFNNHIYFTSDNGIFKIENNSAKLLNFKLDIKTSKFYKPFNSSIYIAATANKYYSINPEKVTSTAFTLPKEEADKVVIVNCFLRDRNNNLWVGTEGNGAIKYDLKTQPMHLITQKQNGISSNFIKGVYKYNNDIILIGTVNKGLNIYNRTIGDNKIILPGHNINYIYRDKKQRLWLGCDDGFYIEKGSLQFEKIPIESIAKLTPGANFVFSITESPNGTVYFGTMYGLHYYNEKENKVKHIFGASYNLTIHFINDNQLLISQYDGSLSISTINPDKSKRDDKALNIKARNPRCVYAENNSILWMATENGLVKYNVITGNTEIYDSRYGLNNTYLYACLPDEKGNIWVSSNGGISIFNKASKRFRNLDLSIGLQSTEFNTGSYHRSFDGELFFGGINGLNHFYPNQIVPDTTAPLLALTGVKVFEKQLDIDSLQAAGNVLELGYRQNSIYLQFAALDFTAPDKNSFTYMLEGERDNWINLGTSNYIRFSALQPGRYTLYLKSANRDGTWCTAKQMLIVIINPPFWQTWWFIALVILVILLAVGILVFSITRRRFRKRVALLEKEKELQRIRLQLSQDIHDDIGGNLSMISLLSDKLSNNAEAAKIADLARNAQKGFRELIWSVNPVHDDLENYIYYLRNYGNTFFEKTDIAINFNMPDSVPGQNLLPNVRRNLFLVYKEALNNVLKHSSASMVNIQVAVADQRITISVTDNGKGISNDISKGNGLENFKYRMEAINGNFQLNSIENRGVSLIFIAPIG